MTKIMRIDFNVDMTQGELPYRSYVSSEPVKGNMFVLASKLTDKDEVYFELYSCDTRNGETTLRVSNTTTMDAFQKSLEVLEADLRKDNPSVKLLRQDGQNVAMSNKGPLSPEDTESVARVIKVKELGEAMVQKAKAEGAPQNVVDSIQNMVNITQMLQEQMLDGNLDRARILIDSLRSGQFQPGLMVDLFAQLSVQEKDQVVEFLKAQYPGDEGHPLFGAMENLKNKPQQDNPYTTNRLKKYM